MAKVKSVFAYFKSDFVAGLIVFLIALPLCLGIAQASGTPMFSGIIAGFIGGIVIGIFSKSTFSVSGPAAGLVAIVIGAMQELGAFNIFLCAVVLSGVFQFVLGLAKAGTFANFFPSSVIEGMLAGIGLTIIFKQIPDGVGYNGPDNMIGMRDGERGMDFNILQGIGDHLHLGAIVITLVCLALLVLWDTKYFKKIKAIPAGLIVVLVGTLLNIVFHNISGRLHLSSEYLVQLTVPKTHEDFLQQFTLPDFSGFLNPTVWQTGLVIAIVASIETLLCIEATDKLDPLKRNTSGNSELKAQGVGNFISGFIGGLPITSVIIRSSANVNAGAKTKMSAIIHGVLLIGCVAAIPAILNFIPKSALAAILIYTGFKLAHPKKFRHMRTVGITEFIPFVVTAVAVALPFLGLLKGVGLGMLISIFYLLRANMRIPYYYKRIKTDDEHIIRLELAEEVSFLNKGSIKTTLDRIPENSSVIIDASNAQYIDYDVLEEIREFYRALAPSKDISVSLIGFRNDYNIPDIGNVHFEMESISEMENALRWSGKHKKLLRELERESMS